MSKIAGIDVGGTFTDLVLVDEAIGEVRLAKVPTTADNQASTRSRRRDTSMGVVKEEVETRLTMPAAALRATRTVCGGHR